MRTYGIYEHTNTHIDKQTIIPRRGHTRTRECDYRHGHGHTHMQAHRRTHIRICDRTYMYMYTNASVHVRMCKHVYVQPHVVIHPPIHRQQLAYIHGYTASATHDCRTSCPACRVVTNHNSEKPLRGLREPAAIRSMPTCEGCRHEAMAAVSARAPARAPPATCFAEAHAPPRAPLPGSYRDAAARGRDPEVARGLRQLPQAGFLSG